MASDLSQRWMTAVADMTAVTGLCWRSLLEQFNVLKSIFSAAFSVFGKPLSLFFQGSAAACVLCTDFLKYLRVNVVTLKPCIESPPLNPSVEIILTYNYCLRDVTINYALISLMQFTILVHRMATMSIVLSTIYLWSFQVALCRSVGCVGVSVVWSAQMGILLHYRRRQQAKRIPSSATAQYWYRTSMACGIAAWIYYAAIAEPITTVAHLCALAMGIVVDMVLQLCEPPRFPPLPPLPPAIVFTGDAGGGDQTFG